MRMQRVATESTLAAAMKALYRRACRRFLFALSGIFIRAGSVSSAATK